MNHETYNEEIIRSFLLGRLPAAEEDAFEIRLLGDADLQTALDAAEYDLIDDYVRGLLTDEEKAIFEKSFSSTTVLRQRMETARMFSNAFQTTPPFFADARRASTGGTGITEQIRRWFFPSIPNRRLVVAFAGGMLATIGLGILVWFFLTPSSVDEGIALLKQTYQHKRPIAGRLSGFAHAGFDEGTLGSSEAVSAEKETLRQAELLFLRAKEDAESLHARGCYYLLAAKSRPAAEAEPTLREAITYLESAAAANPSDARNYNDLGVALLELGRLEKGAKEQDSPSVLTFAKAHENFAKAVEMDPGLLDALFNKALAIERIKPVEEAIKGWEEYLKRDSQSGWAREAREHLDELRERKNRIARRQESLPREFLAAAQSGDEAQLWRAFIQAREQSGNFIAEHLIDQYLILAGQGRQPEAERMIAWLARAAEIESDPGRLADNNSKPRIADLFTRDLVNFYQHSTPQLRAIASRARGLFKQGREKNPTSKPEAVLLYQQAKTLFTQAGDAPEAALANSLIAIIQKTSQQHLQGLATATALALQAERRNYTWLRAQALRTLADVHSNLNEHDAAMNYSRQALALSYELQDPNGIFGILGQQSIFFHALRDHNQSLRLLQQSLDLADSSAIAPLQYWMAYGMLADNFKDLNLLRTALVCERNALALADELKRPLQASRSHAYIGEIYLKLDKFDDAIREAETELQIGRTLPDRAMGPNIEAHALLRLGHFHRRAGNLAQSLDFYNQNINFSERHNIEKETLEARRGRLLIYLAQGNVAAAQAELQIALRFLQNTRASIKDQSLQTSYFDAGQDIHDLAIQLYADHLHDDKRAFDYSEQGRSRSLLDSIKASVEDKSAQVSPILPLTAPQTGEAVQAGMPDALQIVQYAVLSESLRIWVISRTEYFSTSVPVRADDLDVLVTSYLKNISSDNASERVAKSLAGQLYRTLIQPVAGRLDHRKSICFVPDKTLNYLPFAALVDPSNGQYLIENYTISYAPSATVFLLCTAMADQRTQQFVDERALSLGNPLINIESTARQAENIAKLYTTFQLLLGSQANESMLRREMQTAQVIHFATHGQLDAVTPERSHLKLAATGQTPETDGKLEVGEIYRMRLPQTKLVVMSACESGLGRHYRGEGLVGLTSAFLVAGSPLVVSSLWKIPSEPTRKLMEQFHAFRSPKAVSRRTTAQALRDAQVAMKNLPPYEWAGFIVVGGYAAY